jgi:hypothetical protein
MMTHHSAKKEETTYHYDHRGWTSENYGELDVFQHGFSHFSASLKERLDGPGAKPVRSDLRASCARQVSYHWVTYRV